MLKRMSVVICGLAVMLMTAGLASAQSETQEVKTKTKAAAKKTVDATENAVKTTGEVTKNAAKKTGSYLTDAEITAAVKTKLLADSKVSGLAVNVETTDHIVTLTGTVHSAAEKGGVMRGERTTKGGHRGVRKRTVEAKK